MFENFLNYLVVFYQKAKGNNGPVSMLFFITKKGFIWENNNNVEEKFSFSSSFPRENVIFLKKNSSAIERNHFL
jgi:hypothetical protein